MRCLSLLVGGTSKRQTALSSTSACLLLLLAGCLQALGQERRALPGCEAPDQLKKELKETLDPKIFQDMKFADEIAHQVKALDQLIVKYPREGEPAKRLIELAGWRDPSLISAVKDRFEKQERQSPNDPLAQALAGYSLAITDAQQAIRKLDQAKSKAGAFPLPYLLLAEMYSFGKTADTKAMSENILGYFKLCPTSTDSEAQRLLAKSGNNDVQTRVARAIRARLEKETDASGLKDYETVWSLEFRTRPPQEHPAMRKQVAADLKHIENVNPKPDAEFQAFLIRGYQQSDASPEKVKEREERLLREYPRSEEALNVVRTRWFKAHKEPENQTDSAGWAKWEQDYKEALKTWIHDFPDDYDLAHHAWADAIEYDDALSENEVMYVFEADLKYAEQTWVPDPWGYIAAAKFLLQHNLQPRRALDVLRQAEALLAKQHDEEKMNTNRTPAEEEEQRNREDWRWLSIDSQRLEAARQLREPELVQPVRARVEGAAPKEKLLLSWYWIGRAKLAVVESRKADALAYYQLAYQTRTDPPQMWHGKLYDELGDESRALWKELGGTDTGFEVWSKPTPNVQELAEGGWQKPSRLLPEFELVDLSGKTWRLKELNGKAVLINVWATWCGPCQVELPHIQKLYQKVKDRLDLQILTLNDDENSGLIEPFLNEHGYSFPVLPAYGFISNVFASSFGIPQTWIIDSQGRWQWTEVGFGAESDWEDRVIRKLEAAKTSN
jgi:thiol-disulfide isomerase/thioredoxin